MSRPKKNRKNQPTPAGLREQILNDFATLRVPVTADQLDEALKKAQDAGCSHLEFLHRLLSAQAGLRRQRRIERLIKDARFREALPLNTFDWTCRLWSNRRSSTRSFAGTMRTTESRATQDRCRHAAKP